MKNSPQTYTRLSYGGPSSTAEENAIADTEMHHSEVVWHSSYRDQGEPPQSIAANGSFNSSVSSQWTKTSAPTCAPWRNWKADNPPASRIEGINTSSKGVNKEIPSETKPPLRVVLPKEEESPSLPPLAVAVLAEAGEAQKEQSKSRVSLSPPARPPPSCTTRPNAPNFSPRKSPPARFPQKFPVDFNRNYQPHHSFAQNRAFSRPRFPGEMGSRPVKPYSWHSSYNDNNNVPPPPPPPRGNFHFSPKSKPSHEFDDRYRGSSRSRTPPRYSYSQRHRRRSSSSDELPCKMIRVGTGGGVYYRSSRLPMPQENERDFYRGRDPYRVGKDPRAAGNHNLSNHMSNTRDCRYNMPPSREWMNHQRGRLVSVSCKRSSSVEDSQWFLRAAQLVSERRSRTERTPPPHRCRQPYGPKYDETRGKDVSSMRRPRCPAQLGNTGQSSGWNANPFGSRYENQMRTNDSNAAKGGPAPYAENRQKFAPLGAAAREGRWTPREAAAAMHKNMFFDHGSKPERHALKQREYEAQTSFLPVSRCGNNKTAPMPSRTFQRFVGTKQSPSSATEPQPQQRFGIINQEEAVPPPAEKKPEAAATPSLPPKQQQTNQSQAQQQSRQPSQQPQPQAPQQPKQAPSRKLTSPQPPAMPVQPPRWSAARVANVYDVESDEEAQPPPSTSPSTGKVPVHHQRRQ